MKRQAVNPYLPSYEYVPDGEPHKFGDRIYVYGSHDKFDGPNFCMNDYVCWSAPENDLTDWRYEGVIWKKKDDPNYRKGSYMYAPDVCQGPDGKYYIYYAFSPSITRKSWAIRAAVADSPVGPFRYHGEVNLYPWTKEFLPFDPAVYVEDGRVWLYYGSAMFFPVLGVSRRTLKGGAVVELAPDMLTVIGEPKLTVPIVGKDNALGQHAFFEASSLRKIKGKYYFIYSSQLGHELCYATSDAPDGEWTYGGTIVSIGNIGLEDYKDVKTASNNTGNTHGSIVEAAGKYYVFYHRQTNRHCFSRQDCAEEIEIAPDGSIAQVKTTSCGLNGGPLEGKGRYEARIACDLISRKGCRFYGGLVKMSKGCYPYFTQTGKDREDNPDQYIANFCDGATAAYRYFALENTQSVSVSLKGRAKGRIVVRTEKGGDPVALIPVDVSDKENESVCAGAWTGSKEASVSELRFTYEGTGRFSFISFTLE